MSVTVIDTNVAFRRCSQHASELKSTSVGHVSVTNGTIFSTYRCTAPPMQNEENDQNPTGESSHNRNPSGKNQHKDCPSENDVRVRELLVKYHHENITNAKIISGLLQKEGFALSERTILRRRKKFGLIGSSTMTRSLSEPVKVKLVMDQMAKDPLSRCGPCLIKEGLALETGIHLTRDYISEIMRTLDPNGFASREPTARKIQRGILVAVGPHDEWSCDGHDKLVKYGFPIWGVCDKWGGKWLGLWVIPNNRYKDVIAYLWLSLIKDLGGMPVQTTTDCGSETTRVFGFANALRGVFSPDLPMNELPAHRFLRSIDNITVERGWFHLRIQWGDNVVAFWKAGEGIYDSSDPDQYELVQWLWPNLIQRELNALRERFNSHKVCRDRNKKLPSGVSPNVAYAMPDRYNAIDCLQQVDGNVIQEIMDAIGGEDLIRFVSIDYAARAQQVFDSLWLPPVTLHNVWEVFRKMMPVLHPQ